MIIHSPIISGSLTFADGGTLSLPNPTELSGSFSGSAQFSEITSHIIPDTANTYDLGSATNYFRDLYISTGSLKGMGNGTVAFKLSGKSGGGLKVTDDNDDEVEIVAKEITLKDTSGNGNNIKLKVQNGALKSTKVDNSDTEDDAEEVQTLQSNISGSLIVTGSTSLEDTTIAGTVDATGLASLDGGVDVDGAFTVADSTGNVSTSGTLGVTGTSTLGVINASGLLSADAGIDVDGAFTVADSTGNVVTSGTLSAGNTTVGTLGSSGLASLDGGIDVDGAFTVADSTGNVSTSGTLGAGNTTISGTVGATGLASLDGGVNVDDNFTVDASGNTVVGGTLDSTGLASLDGGVDVDGAFTVANTSGNVATSGTLNVTGLTTVGVISGSAMDITGNLGVGGDLTVAGAMTNDGHVIPAVHNTYDLGSTTKYWRDLYLSSGSLYINGIQVLSTDGTDLTFRTDAGESVKILETGNDTITLESVNGDITLTATGTGNIELDAPVQIAAGKNILSSDGNAIAFASDVSLGSNNIFAANLSGVVSSSAITYSGDDISVAGNTILVGNLTVQGTTTSVDSNTVNIGDNQIVLNSDETGTPSQNGGIAIERGTETNASIIWNETNDYWMSGLLGAESRIVVGAGNTDITTLGTIATGVWNGTAITHDYIGLDAIDSTNIADNAINSEHYVDGSIDTAHIADSQITVGKMAANSVDSDQYVDGSIDRVHLAADIIDSTKIADDAIGNEHLADDAVDSAQIADGAIDTVHISDLNVTRGKIEADAIDSTKLADNAVNSEHYTDGSIDTVHIGDLQVTNGKIAADAIDGAKIADNAIDSEHYTDGSIDLAHLAADSVNGTKIADDSIDSEHYVDGSIDNAHIAADAVDGAKIADDSIDSEHYVDGSIDAAHLASNSVETAKIADDAVTSAKLEGSYTGTWAVTGAITATGDITAYASSDERLKDNIQNIENPIEKVQSLKGVTWDWNDNASDVQHSLPNVGVIAQDVEKVLPQLVRDNEGGYKAVDYDKLVGLLIEAVKDQQSQIDELKSKLG